MIFGKSKVELKVGIFVAVGLVVLMIFVLLIGDFKNQVSAYKVKFQFNFINGVRPGAPVRFAGVDVGQVQKIALVPRPEEHSTKIEIIGIIRKDIKIPVDSQVWVNTLGILGEKYIDVMPGKNYTDFIPENATMIGNDPVAMHEFGELAKSIVQKLDASITEIKGVVGSVDNLAKNLNDGVTRIKNKEGTVGKLLYDDKLYNDLDALVNDIKAHPWKLFIKTKEKAEPKAVKK
ncbi:MAG: MlaD family protein [Candidatus Omnitrophica bacterium]|nr:MlaD family protein [Candidatus Omnitrophota bacterium]